MNGQVPTPTSAAGGPSAGVIAVRVVITVVTVLTCGFFAWVAMLRIAIMRRDRRNWLLFWGQLVLNIACLACLQERLADHWISDVGMALLLAQMAAVTAYYLTVDIRHHRPAPFAPVGPPPYHLPGYTYGTAATVPNPYAGPVAHTPVTHTPVAHTPVGPAPVVPGPATPVPQPPGPRIDQVRAELDELSDLLRKEPGEPREGEGGR
ncbi:hypothetical protein [Streptomyces sp. bgisy126]|uniref:hypothetical protein n=1 Tax=unclassified Streptomyces TaxID=2593676 RepID=UPI003EC0432D